MKKVIGKKSVDIELDISPCPCCGSENVKFYKNLFERNTEASAAIYCDNCGHRIGTEMDYMNKGISEPDLYCLENVIESWNNQYKKFGKITDNNSKKVKRLEELVMALKKIIIQRYKDMYLAHLTDEEIIELSNTPYITNNC